MFFSCKIGVNSWHSSIVLFSVDLRLLLGGGGLCLGGLLAVASNHDHAQERTNDSGTEENEDDRDADSPDTWEEEVLQRVVIIDKGLRHG